MFGIGMPELIVILLIVLIIFGAGKLPEIGTGLGRAIRGFKKGMSESDPEDSKQVREGDRKNNSTPSK
jgi:sec-independent protein translocase protein TatA